MANKIYIEYYSYEKEVDYNVPEEGSSLAQHQILSNANILELPLLDDVKIESASQFSGYSEMIPKIGDIVNFVTGVSSGITGEISSELLDLKNKFDLPKWQKTDPIKINVNLGFFTKTDSWKDVYKPVKDIIGMSILSKDPNDETSYIVPGISVNTMKEYTLKSKQGKEQPAINDLKAKIIAVEIPGIVYIPLAYVEMAMPTYSKQQTEQGFPLWCSLDCIFSSVSPATTEMFNNANRGTDKNNRREADQARFDQFKKASKILG